MDANDKLFYRLNDRARTRSLWTTRKGGDLRLYEDEIRSVEGPDASEGRPGRNRPQPNHGYGYRIKAPSALARASEEFLRTARE